MAEVIEFAEYLRMKRRQLDEETRSWMDASLTPELGVYDWGGEDPLAGEPVRWDEGLGSFVVDAADGR